VSTGLSDAVIRLRTLGSVDLRAADGSQISAVIRQPKRLALLIYLALSGAVFHRRDRLLALFWPESDERGARGSLSQALFHLRAALGKDAIVNRGDEEIGVAHDQVWCDVVAFRNLTRAGRHADAMELYQGELLPSFTVADLPEFEDWLADQRRSLAEQAAESCQQLSRAAEQDGEAAAAIRWMRRAVAIEPFNEPAHQRLITLLDRSGDRAAALRAFEELRAALHAEFEADPSAETLEVMRAVRARAEASPRVREASSVSNVRVTPELAAAMRPHQRRRRRFIFAGSTVLVVAAVIWSALYVRPKPY